MSAHPNDAFRQLMERHRNELRLHCYRMLGSSCDSDDVLQETMIRAWRARDTLQAPSSSRAWLYRIATNVCLDELGRRRKRRLPAEAGPPAVDPTGHIAPADREACIEPCPDAWFAEVPCDPSAKYELRESVALAFVAALHHLTATQRAALLLRDVVGFSAEETSEALELGLEATNSALFRARRAVEGKIGGNEASVVAPKSGAKAEALLERYLRAWNELDIGTFVALLHEEVKTTMPPSPTWIAGRTDNAAFYAPMFAAQKLGTFFARPTAANGQPAFAFYRATDAQGPLRLRAIQLVTVKDGAVSSIDHFMLPELARVFGLPEEIERTAEAWSGRSCVEHAADAVARLED